MSAALFDAIYDEHHRVIYAYLLGQSGSRDSAADLLQETFVRAWKHIDRLGAMPTDQRRYWLLAVARNLALDDRRRESVRARHAAEELGQTNHAQDPAESVIANECAAAVDAAVAALPVELRTILAMHVSGGMTSAEIGRALGKPAGTVRYQLSLARRQLAKSLGLTEETCR